MQREFRQLLRHQGHQPGVMRPGRDFREPDLIAFHEQFDAENAKPAQRAGDGGGHVAGLFARRLAHRLRLPAFHIIAVLLDMADGLAEMGAVRGAHRELGDLEIEFDLAFHDHPRLAHPPGAERLFPGRRDIVGGFQPRLALAGRRHHRLDETGKADAAAAACNSSSEEAKA